MRGVSDAPATRWLTRRVVVMDEPPASTPTMVTTTVQFIEDWLRFCGWLL